MSFELVEVRLCFIDQPVVLLYLDIRALNGSQLAKMEKYISYMSLLWNL